MQWTPEFERRYQFVEGLYNETRRIGLQQLQVLLSTGIVLAGIPLVFHEKVYGVFAPSGGMPWIYASWLFVLCALIPGFVSLALTFEGYYHHAIAEQARIVYSKKASAATLKNKSNRFYDVAH